MMKIFIRNLCVNTLIGVGDKERRSSQDIFVSLEIVYDADKAVSFDSIADAVDYQTLADEITHRVAQSHFYLIEKLADEILDIVMGDRRILEAKVRIDKPRALKSAESVGVELFRKRHE